MTLHLKERELSQSGASAWASSNCDNKKLHFPRRVLQRQQKDDCLGFNAPLTITPSPPRSPGTPPPKADASPSCHLYVSL